MSKTMNTCEQIKEVLVATGREGIEQNANLAEHLKDCADCQRLLEAWARIPGLLEQLPEHEPDAALLQNVRSMLASGGRKAASGRRFIAPSLASAAILLAAIGLSRELLMQEAPKAPVPMQRTEALEAPPGKPDRPASADRLEDAVRPEEERYSSMRKQSGASDGKEESGDYRAGQSPQFAARLKVRENQNLEQGADRRQLTRAGEPASSSIGDEAQVRNRVSGQMPVEEPGPYTLSEEFSHAQEAGRKDSDKEIDELKSRADENLLRFADNEDEGVAIESEGARERFVIEKTEVTPATTGRLAASPSSDSNTPVAGAVGGSAVAGQAGKDAFDFLAFYQQTDNLQFQPPNGYWANTYVPGDPEIRWLSARLAQWDRSWLQNQGALEQSVVPLAQPFDPPQDNALSLTLMADANAVMPKDGVHKPTRLRLQVGIRGIEHRRGQRPAMNVGMVIDLPADAPDTVRIAARSLVDALLQSRQPGDRFSLVVTGRPGLVLKSADFRFGPLQLARQSILGQGVPDRQTGAGGTDSIDLDLYGAVELAGSLVQQSDEPGRPLGSSSIVLVSAREVENLDRLLTLVHQRARAGVTLSVFPLGYEARAEQAARLALAGLGNRRFLETPDQARRLVEEELHASSRAVARAARLSIRLAPGVHLVGVVGSERLDTERAQRVREIENSMDRRLSDNLGIQADRGADEDGIQIVIPTIYSADSVTVLLDLVTDRPGAIADVSLRYKDLVYLRNGSLQSHLDLPEGELNRGPAELAVLKNLLSHHFVMAVRQAADALSREQPGQAANFLRQMHATLEQVRRAVPAWGQDPDLVHDQQVLDQYISALGSPQADAHRSFLVDSLQYAAWAKTHRGLKEWR